MITAASISVSRVDDTLMLSKVLSDYTGEIREEDATGRFHASIALSRQAFDECGGWPLTMRGDFDQQLLARLVAVGESADPCSAAEPGYVFRWSSTGLITDSR
jgi:hypothetical protein